MGEVPLYLDSEVDLPTSFPKIADRQFLCEVTLVILQGVQPGGTRGSTARPLSTPDPIRTDFEFGFEGLGLRMRVQVPRLRVGGLGFVV